MPRSVSVLVLVCLLLLPVASAPASAPVSAAAPAPGTDVALILADPADPYYSLAQEMAVAKGLPIVHSLDQALVAQPAFLLWVVSPGRLSDQAMIDFGLAMRDRSAAISSGIISGATLGDARALWQRSPAARGERVYAVNAANPSGNIEAGIAEAQGTVTKDHPLTKTNLVQSLQRADYLTFTGHGGSTLLALAVVTLLLFRRKAPPRLLLPAALTGLSLAALHGLYALARLERLSVTSKGVDFSLLAPTATFLLVTCGAFFFFRAGSWRGRAVALAVATLGALAPVAFLFLWFGVADGVIMGRQLGVGLWNCRLGLQPLVVFVLGAAILGPVFHLVRKSQS